MRVLVTAMIREMVSACMSITYQHNVTVAAKFQRQQAKVYHAYAMLMNGCTKSGEWFRGRYLASPKAVVSYAYQSDSFHTTAEARPRNHHDLLMMFDVDLPHRRYPRRRTLEASAARFDFIGERLSGENPHSSEKTCKFNTEKGRHRVPKK
jgi:hypothetical protein